MAPGMAVHKTFTYHELHYASAGFSTDSVVGEGGFGNVYKGQLPDGTLIAIKRLDRCGLQVSTRHCFTCSLHTVARCTYSQRMQDSHSTGVCDCKRHRFLYIVHIMCMHCHGAELNTARGV